MNPSTIRERVFVALHGVEGEGLTRTQRFIFTTIIIGVALAIVGTEPELPDGMEAAIELVEGVIGIVFLVEYVARIWSIGALPRYAGFRGRLLYITRPIVIIDLIALVPFLLGAIGAESLLLRSIRVLRLLALSKMVRYSEAMRIVVASVIARRFELSFAFLLAGLMLLLSSAALYVVEADIQPKAFGSIPRAMWWAVATLTTVGYGDVVPVSVLGKFFAGLTAIAGIGMIAMPTGILAASFADGFAKAREAAAKAGTAQGESAQEKQQGRHSHRL
jgi:voltage-gated potassium channel